MTRPSATRVLSRRELGRATLARQLLLRRSPLEVDAEAHRLLALLGPAGASPRVVWAPPT